MDRENQFNKQCCLVTCLLIISVKRFWALWAIFVIYVCYNSYHGFAVKGYWTLWSNIYDCVFTTVGLVILDG